MISRYDFMPHIVQHLGDTIWPIFCPTKMVQDGNRCGSFRNTCMWYSRVTKFRNGVLFLYSCELVYGLGLCSGSAAGKVDVVDK